MNTTPHLHAPALRLDSHTPAHPLMLQAFAWDLRADTSHWRFLTAHAADLADLGVSAVWLPPAYKGYEGTRDVGYGVYDLYDLGEFNQKGAIPTKYGTKEEYLAAIRALHDVGIAVVADIVLNHRMGADASQIVHATPVDPDNRMRPLGPSEEIEAWTRFTFPQRAGKYSDFTWDWTCFHGIDWDHATGRQGVWLFEGKEWNTNVNGELGNYDYLMGADVHVTEPRVRDELVTWGRWYVETTGVDALRLDAVKHVGSDFFAFWLEELRRSTGSRLPAVGEYWSGDVNELLPYLEKVPGVSLFDVPLHYRLHDASVSDGTYDLRTLFDGTLTQLRPERSVTFVENHDTQPGQSLASRVEDWLKPAAYALILLWEAGVPCVFWGDLFGTPESGDLPAVRELPPLMRSRAQAALGAQHVAFDDPDIVGFSREGDAHIESSGCAVVISKRRAGEKCLYVGYWHAGQVWESLIGGGENVRIGTDGWASFPVGESGLSVYRPEASASE